MGVQTTEYHSEINSAEDALPSGILKSFLRNFSVQTSKNDFDGFLIVEDEWRF